MEPVADETMFDGVPPAETMFFPSNSKRESNSSERR